MLISILDFKVFYKCICSMRVKHGNTWTQQWGDAFYDTIEKLSSDATTITSVDVYMNENYFSGIRINGGIQCVGDCSNYVGTASPGGELYYVAATFSVGYNNFGINQQTFTRIIAISFGFICR